MKLTGVSAEGRAHRTVPAPGLANRAAGGCGEAVEVAWARAAAQGSRHEDRAERNLSRRRRDGAGCEGDPTRERKVFNVAGEIALPGIGNCGARRILRSAGKSGISGQ